MRPMSVLAPTERYVKVGTDKWTYAGSSPNRGLECYLGEAALRYGAVPEEEIFKLVNRLKDQARNLDGYPVWGWEKEPSIDGVYFPPDWDDTAKAIDFAKAAGQRFSYMDLKTLPDGEFLKKHIRGSLFICPTLGEDYTLDSDRYHLALSVFFGRGASIMPPREDPMVSICLLRMVSKHYPSVLNAMEDIFVGLIRRCCIILSVHLDQKIPFSRLSRYYFSSGHFALRLLEVLNQTGWGIDQVGLPLTGLKRQIGRSLRYLKLIDKHNGDQAATREAIWWYLVGCTLGEQVTSLELPPAQPQSRGIEIVFRHRRLNHYYGTPNWSNRLQHWELQGLERKSLDHIVEACRPA